MKIFHQETIKQTSLITSEIRRDGELEMNKYMECLVEKD